MVDNKKITAEPACLFPVEIAQRPQGIVYFGPRYLPQMIPSLNTSMIRVGFPVQNLG